jgi:hypothetical protein
MLGLKPLSKEAIPAALARVERYRLLNEPEQAESICLDILRTEPGNQQAIVALILALTDQFADGIGARVGEAHDLLNRLTSEYDYPYYAGIICERRARALLRMGGPGAGFMAFDWIRDAMMWYEKAESFRPAGNDDALLRWNTCQRFLTRNPHLEPVEEERAEPLLLE